MNFRELLCESVGGVRYITRASYPKVWDFFQRRRDKNVNSRSIYDVKVCYVAPNFLFYSIRNGEFFATLYPDDTVEVTTNNVYSARYPLQALTANWVFSRYRENLKHRVRFYSSWGGETWREHRPLVKGLKFKDGKCINPELAVDIVRTVKPEVRKAWTQLFTPWRALMNVLCRLEGKQYTYSYDYTPTELLAEIHGEPTAEAAEDLLRFGMGYVRYRWRHTHDSEHNPRAMANVTKQLRNAFYKENDAYVWSPKTA